MWNFEKGFIFPTIYLYINQKKTIIKKIFLITIFDISSYSQSYDENLWKKLKKNNIFLLIYNKKNYYNGKDIRKFFR